MWRSTCLELQRKNASLVLRPLVSLVRCLFSARVSGVSHSNRNEGFANGSWWLFEVESASKLLHTTLGSEANVVEWILGEEVAALGRRALRGRHIWVVCVK